MSVPKGSRYTKGFGKMFKSTGRFGAIAGKPLGRSQRGMTYVLNPNTGKYAESLEAEPVEAWIGSQDPEKLASAVRRAAEIYGVDLTGPDAMRCIPFVLEKATEFLED